jgi:hypothetical protein
MSAMAYYLNVILIAPYEAIANAYREVLARNLPLGARGISFLLAPEYSCGEKGHAQLSRQAAAMHTAPDHIEIVVIVGDLDRNGRFINSPMFWMAEQRLPPRFTYGWSAIDALVTERCQHIKVTPPCDMLACLCNQSLFSACASRDIWATLTNEIRVRATRDGMNSIHSLRPLAMVPYNDDEYSYDEPSSTGNAPPSDPDVHNTEPEV